MLGVVEVALAHPDAARAAHLLAAALPVGAPALPPGATDRLTVGAAAGAAALRVTGKAAMKKFRVGCCVW